MNRGVIRFLEAIASIPTAIIADAMLQAEDMACFVAEHFERSSQGQSLEVGFEGLSPKLPKRLKSSEE